MKTLSNLCGKCLKTLPVTSAMDTTDILGGFEQVSDLFKYFLGVQLKFYTDSEG